MPQDSIQRNHFFHILSGKKQTNKQTNKTIEVTKHGLGFYGNELNTHHHLWSQTDVTNTLMSQDGDTQFTAKKLSELEFGEMVIGHPDLQLGCKCPTA